LRTQAAAGADYEKINQFKGFPATTRLSRRQHRIDPTFLCNPIMGYRVAPA